MLGPPVAGRTVRNRCATVVVGCEATGSPMTAPMGSGGDGYRRFQQEDAGSGPGLASNLKAQIDPFQSPLVRLGWMATKTLRMTRTWLHVATRGGRRGATGYRGLLQASSWSAANPVDMRESARVGTSGAALEASQPSAIQQGKTRLERLVPTYARLLMWPTRQTPGTMFLEPRGGHLSSTFQAKPTPIGWMP